MDTDLQPSRDGYQDNAYLRVEPEPDQRPLVDPTLLTLPRLRWWEDFSVAVDDRLPADVVEAFFLLASEAGYTVDVDYVALVLDPDTGLEMPDVVRRRGLAALFLIEDVEVVCADPHGTAPVRVPLEHCTYVRLDPFSGGSPMQVPS